MLLEQLTNQRQLGFSSSGILRGYFDPDEVELMIDEGLFKKVEEGMDIRTATPTDKGVTYFSSIINSLRENKRTGDSARAKIAGIKYFYNTRLGETRYQMADGSLLCKDVPIARTGKQLYSEHDLPDLIPDSDGEIVVERTPEEVFDEATMASFEGMSVTILHPENEQGDVIFINPENWRGRAVGHLQNNRRGEGGQSDLMVTDLIIKDREAIDYINNGLCEVSCGYEAKYQQLAPGKARQYLIRGNHVALVPKGRAGNRCKIGDTDTMATPKQNWLIRLKRAIKTGDADTASELLENAPASVTGDEGEGSLPKAINITVNPQQPLPDKDPEMGGQHTGDSDDDLKTLLKALLAKLDGSPVGNNAETPAKEPVGDADSEKDEEESTVTGDAAYRAELIIPGLDLSKKTKPTAFMREVLSSADKGLVRRIVGDADVDKLPKSAVNMAFNAVSELAKSRNIQTRTVDNFRQTANTIAELNKQNREFWSNRKG